MISLTFQQAYQEYEVDSVAEVLVQVLHVATYLVCIAVVVVKQTPGMFNFNLLYGRYVVQKLTTDSGERWQTAAGTS